MKFEKERRAKLLRRAVAYNSPQIIYKCYHCFKEFLKPSITYTKYGQVRQCPYCGSLMIVPD